MILAKSKCWTCAAGINGLAAIVMGAVAAHGIGDAHMASLADKASLYQLLHAVLLAAIADRQGKLFCRARWMFLVGVILFSGSLYVRALTGWEAIAELAPMGGLSFMAGWLLLALAGYRGEDG